MDQQIDQLYENLKVKLSDTKSHIDSINSKMKGKAQQADQEVRSHLDQVQRRIDKDRTKVKAAQAEVKSWIEAQKSATAAKIVEWKAKHEIRQLQNRANSAERYAAASIDVALAAIDNAEQAALEAWLARQDADAAQAGR